MPGSAQPQRQQLPAWGDLSSDSLHASGNYEIDRLLVTLERDVRLRSKNLTRGVRETGLINKNRGEKKIKSLVSQDGNNAECKEAQKSYNISSRVFLCSL